MLTTALMYRLTIQEHTASARCHPGFVNVLSLHILSGIIFYYLEDYTMKKPFTTLELVMMAMFTAILCGSAYLSIPTPLPGAAHITLLNFMIILIALVFEVKDSAIIIALWMILGAIGVPVFIGGGSGLGYLFGMFGGYTFSFIIAAIVVGIIKGKKYNRIRYTVSAAIGVVVIDVIGMIWYKFMGHLDWKTAFLAGFCSFIVLDLVKAVVAAQIVPVFARLLPDKEKVNDTVAQTE